MRMHLSLDIKVGFDDEGLDSVKALTIRYNSASRSSGTFSISDLISSFVAMLLL